MAKETPFDRARDFVEEKIDQTKDVLGDSYTKARDQFDDVSDDVRKNVEDDGASASRRTTATVWDDVAALRPREPGHGARDLARRSGSSSASCSAATTTRALRFSGAALGAFA